MEMREYLSAVKAETPLAKTLQGPLPVPVICFLSGVERDRTA